MPYIAQISGMFAFNRHLLYMFTVVWNGVLVCESSTLHSITVRKFDRTTKEQEDSAGLLPPFFVVPSNFCAVTQ